MPTCCCTWSTARARMLDEQIAEVERVLGEIGADGIPQVLVFNKLDRLEDTQRPRVDARPCRAAVRAARAARLRQRARPAKGSTCCASC